MINWDEAEKAAGGNFLPKAKPGAYRAKVNTVDVRETKNKQGGTTYWLDLILMDGENCSYPKISHAISRNNINWCAFHFMSILKELGIAEEKAKAAIEACESKNGTENIIAQYHATFDRATQKHPEIEVEVYESDNINPKTGRPYMRADFGNPRIAFARDNSTASATSGQESLLEEGEDVTADLGDVPF